MSTKPAANTTASSTAGRMSPRKRPGAGSPEPKKGGRGQKKGGKLGRSGEDSMGGSAELGGSTEQLAVREEDYLQKRKNDNEAYTKIKHCPNHSDEPIVMYCRECQVAICAVCSALYHDGHLKEYLFDLCARNHRRLQPEVTATDGVAHKLESLLDSIDDDEAALHDYIETEVSALYDVLESKRGELHRDSTGRAENMRKTIAQEIKKCEDELAKVDETQAVLKALANNEGVVEGELGKLILGKMSYAEFHERAHFPLHTPARMVSQQGLQLPIQDLQLMCDLVDWTPLSVNNAPQLFP